jgi:ribosomal protein L7/L12/sugar lactone lactonase YvrE
MSIAFNCPSCSAPLDVDDEKRSVRCPYCQNTVVVPAELRNLDEHAASPAAPQILSMEMDLGSLIGQATRFRDVIDLARSGKKIEAIKLYRQLTGLGLKESKDAVEALTAGQTITVTSTSLAEPFVSQAEAAERSEKLAALDQVAQLVREGNKIEAIKVYRQTFDSSLAEAKTAVERIEAGEYMTVQNMALGSPYIPQIIPPQAVKASVATTAAAAGGVGCFAWVIGIMIVLSIIVPVFFAFTSPGGPLAGLWNQINPAAYARVVKSFGSEGTGPGLFSDPRAVAVDSEGFIYVAEFSDGRIQRFNSAGEYQSQWNIGDDSYTPAMIALRDGSVYVISSGKIQHYAGATGENLGSLEFDEDYYFDFIALSPEGKLVAVVLGETILRFDSQGKLELASPRAISTVSNDAELDTQIAVDGLGNIYALGTFNDAVFKFSPEGRFITRFGSDGDEPGQFSAPGAIAVDGQGRVYVSDMKGIQVFDSEGRYLDKISTEGYVFGMTITTNNQLVAVSNTPKVYIYDLP